MTAVPSPVPQSRQARESFLRAPTAFFVVATGTALVAALAAPLGIAVAGLAVFGVAHVGLETRYVVGRFSPRLGWRTVAAFLVPITAIAAARLLGGTWAGPFEAAAAFALAGAGWCWATRTRPWLCLTGLAILAAGAASAMLWVAWFVVLVAHLHNLTPLGFLWDWSGTALPAAGRRRAFRSAQVGWILFVPALILVGAFDALVASGGLWRPGTAGTVDQVAALYTPPALRSGVWPLRFLTVFAFLQTMHYVVWIGFLPFAARTESRAAGAAGPLGLAFRPRYFGIACAAVAAAVAVAFAADYATGKWLYGALASYHAYVEFPILVMVAVAAVGLAREIPPGGRRELPG